MARRRPKMTYKALAASTSPPIFKATIQRILRKYNLKKWKSKQRIPLSKEAAKARFEFVRCWRQNTQLLEVIYSDECSVQRKPNNTVKFVFRYQKEAFRSDLVNLRNHGKDISQMVWAAIWRGGRSELVIMERDNEAPRGGYSTNSYIKSLEEGLLPIYSQELYFSKIMQRFIHH
jgi:hypothetical protein